MGGSVLTIAKISIRLETARQESVPELFEILFQYPVGISRRDR
jgi:hypothetical protein